MGRLYGGMGWYAWGGHVRAASGGAAALSSVAPQPCSWWHQHCTRGLAGDARVRLAVLAQVVEEVASSRVALQLLLDGQDYAGALDLLEVRAHAIRLTPRAHLCMRVLSAGCSAHHALRPYLPLPVPLRPPLPLRPPMPLQPHVPLQPPVPLRPPQVVAHSMEANCSQGLKMFAQALPQMRETRELLESLLACEFVGLAGFGQVGIHLLL